MPGPLEPVGAVLAGGLGERAGGDKAMLPIAGRPMVSYGLAALREGLGREPVVVAKGGTALPPGLEVWIEPDEPRHPLTGIVHALERAAGRHVLVLAVDLPLMTPAVVARLVETAAATRSVTVVAREPGGRVQPLCGAYAPSALDALRAASGDGRGRLTSIIDEIGAVAVEVPSEVLSNVNTPADARLAEALLRGRGRAHPNVNA